ncbi:MAG: hypothetical protein HUJ29_00580 [Gammaproteobacteria bacterium]|nr:hypothetical protein [Gammaproteobacteria bacterium]
MSDIKRRKGFTALSVIMAIFALSELDGVYYLFKPENIIDFAFGLLSAISGILAVFLTVGFWKVKKWIYKITLVWILAFVLKIIIMVPFLEQFENVTFFGWYHAATIITLNLIIFYGVIRYIKRVLVEL